MKGLLEGKWAFVTGASRGIGKALSLGLAAEGCNLILCSRKIDHCEHVRCEAQKYGVEAICVQAALQNTDDVKQMLQNVDTLGIDVDILFNVAAVNSNNLDFFSIPTSYFDMTFSVNFIAPLMLIQHFLPGMLKRRYGRIINVGSDAHNEPKAMPYICSKQALWSLTKEMGYALNGTNIMINLIDPGWCRTDMGTDNAPCEAEDSVTGLLLGAALNDRISGRYIKAQEYSGMDLESAIEKAKENVSYEFSHEKLLSKDDFYLKLRDFIESPKKKIIFGGGNQAKFFKDLLEYYDCKVDAFLCTNKHGNDYLCGMPLYEMDEFPYNPDDVEIVIAITETAIDDVSLMLEEKGFNIGKSYGILYTAPLWADENGKEISEVYSLHSDTFNGGKIG